MSRSSLAPAPFSPRLRLCLRLGLGLRGNSDRAISMMWIHTIGLPSMTGKNPLGLKSGSFEHRSDVKDAIFKVRVTWATVNALLSAQHCYNRGGIRCEAAEMNPEVAKKLLTAPLKWEIKSVA